MNVTRLGGEGSKLFNGIMIQYQDITRHKQAEQQIHELTQRLITAQENERQRISRYLHDRVAQDLSSIKIGCETIFDQDTHVPDSIRHHIFHWSGILKDTISVVRDMSYDLHPAGLEQLGLIQTLSNNCEGFTDKTGIPVEFLTAGLDDIDLNFDTQINLFRVIQEALNNIASHAQASHVMIKLVRSYPHIMLRIEDNGKGFDINRQTLSSLATKHIGIQSMKERIRLLNGSFEIQSQPMKGTKIHIKIPFMDEEA
ncbi:MAG: sensor histidine kinase [Desulfobacterales bacterium]|nr:sensor histidine kinase [Desulfobacterales bacterium]MDD4072978.1 sensor histidine kinase [Desulfobacterales bacterium]MDD4393642.1 sensor histidine kinase [Desulfobacterales bacterium]